MAQSLEQVRNLAKIEASHWSRAQNPGFLLVERTLRKYSKGVPLRSWTSSNRWILKQIGSRFERLVIEGFHLKVGSSGVSLYRGKRPRSRPWDEILLLRLGPMDWRSNWHSIAFNWKSIGIQLTVHWHYIGNQLSSLWYSIGIDRIHLKVGSSGVSLYRGKRPRSLPWDRFCTIETGSQKMTLKLGVNCHSIVCQLESNCQLIDIQLAVNWYSNFSLLLLHWQSIGIQLSVNWHYTCIQLFYHWYNYRHWQNSSQGRLLGCFPL